MFDKKKTGCKFLVFIFTGVKKYAKPLVNYRQKTELVWRLDEETKAYVYCLTESDIRVDLVKTGAQKDIVISLTPDQFSTLYHLSEMVSTAIRKSKYFTYELGGLVHLTHQEFRKKKNGAYL